MSNFTRFSVVLLVICCVAASSSFLHRPYRKDVCEHTPEAHDPKIVCYCQQFPRNSPYAEFKKADCWVHGNNLREDDVAWDGFGRSSNIRELSFVVFSEDQLKFLPQKGMYYLLNLTKFSLTYADIPLINSYAFSKLDKLEEIFLTTNNISTLEDYAFLKLEHLRVVDLSHNQIRHVDKHVFYKNYKLESLNLTVNNITTISDRAFADLNNLVELHLDFNMLQRVTSATLEGLSSLKNLTLAGNYISVLDEDLFEPVPSLEFLDLAQNALQFITPSAFKWTPRLRHINLEQNELKFLDANLFRSMPNLGYLNVGKNLLSTFEVDRDRFMVERFLGEESVLFMNENNLVCDCRLLWLYEVRNRTRSGKIQKHLDHLNCELMEKHQQRPEQVFLLRLHYENFDCTSAMISSTTEFSVDVHGPRHTSRLKGQSAMKNKGIRLPQMNTFFGIFVCLIAFVTRN